MEVSDRLHPRGKISEGPGADRNALKTRKSPVSAGNYSTNPPSSASILVIFVEKQCAKETVYRQERVVTGQYSIILFTCMAQIPFKKPVLGNPFVAACKISHNINICVSAKILHSFPTSCM